MTGLDDCHILQGNANVDLEVSVCCVLSSSDVPGSLQIRSCRMMLQASQPCFCLHIASVNDCSKHIHYELQLCQSTTEQHMMLQEPVPTFAVLDSESVTAVSVQCRVTALMYSSCMGQSAWQLI